MKQIQLTDQLIARAKTLSARIKVVMPGAGFNSGAALAKRVGVTRQTVYYWLDGTTKGIDSATLAKVAQALGVRQEWLLTGELPYLLGKVTRDDDEAQIIGFYRRMIPQDQAVFLKMARTLADDSDKPATRDDPFPRAPRR